MLRLTVLVMCIFALHPSNGQSVKGKLLSSKDSSVIENAHVINISQHKMTTSNENGRFTIEANPGDTLYISNINFKSRQFVIREYLELLIKMDPLEIELNEVEVTNLPSDEEDFKKILKNMPILNPNDSLPFGVTPGKPKGPVPKKYERETKLIFNGGIGLPISFFTKKFSKRHKAERDYYEAKSNMGTTINNSKKYNRALVTELTTLQDQALTDFMNYMDLDPAFIKRSSEYEIASRILKEYEEYKAILQTDSLDDE